MTEPSGHRIVPMAWRPLTPVVIKTPVEGGGVDELATIVLKVVRFGVTRSVSRFVTEDYPAWSEARLVMEHSCQRALAELMSGQGWVPVGPQEWETVEDLTTWETQLTLTQYGMEDSNPVWLAVRRALDEDRAWFADPVNEDISVDR